MTGSPLPSAAPVSVAMAVLLTLAGCSGVPGAGGAFGGGGATGTSTLTPVDVPAEGGAASAGGEVRAVGGRRLAPGLRTGGVRDPPALAATHHDRLANRSFTRTDSRTVVDRNGTLLATRTELEVRPGGTPFLVSRSAVAASRYDGSRPPTDVTIYHDGLRAASRVVENGSVGYRIEDNVPPAAVEPDRTGRRVVGRLLTAFEWEVTRVEIGGEPHYQLASDGLLDRGALSDVAGLDSPRDPEVRMLVGPDGRVERYRLQYGATVAGARVGVTETARWSAVDETLVEVPDWLGRALRERTGGARPGTATASPTPVE
ncbi:hypothetical protein [Haloglomus litoreum]|uniref:hypothetical protein n=1 Tax=Haloglomus litoreum TaxID=3034026 RepID=UPI0023E84C01|nr:hypothetical protein [Haloglomus sp. DT116]